MSNESNKNAKNVWTLVIAFLGVSLILLLFYAPFVGWLKISKSSQDWANFATYYTGIISPIVTTAGLYFIIQTFQLQQEQLQEFRKQATENTSSFEKQLLEMQKQTQVSENNMQKQLEAINKQNEISERNMEKQIMAINEQTKLNSKNTKEQLEQMQSQNALSFSLSMLDKMSDMINNHIRIKYISYFKTEFSNYTESYMIFFIDKVKYLEESLKDEDKTLTKILNIINNSNKEISIFNKINHFLDVINKLMIDNNQQKIRMIDILIYGQLNELTNKTNSILCKMENIIKNIQNTDLFQQKDDEEKKEIIKKFQFFRQPLNTFLTLTSTGEAENETTIA